MHLPDLWIASLSNLPTLLVGAASVSGLSHITSFIALREIDPKCTQTDRRIGILTRHIEFNTTLGACIVNGLAIFTSSLCRPELRSNIAFVTTALGALTLLGVWIWNRWTKGSETLTRCSRLYQHFFKGVPLLLALVKLLGDYIYPLPKN